MTAGRKDFKPRWRSTAAHGPRTDFPAAAKNSGPRSQISHPSLPRIYASMLLCLTWPPGSSYSNDLTVRMEPSTAPAVKSYDAAKNAR